MHGSVHGVSAWVVHGGGDGALVLGLAQMVLYTSFLSSFILFLPQNDKMRKNKEKCTENAKSKF